MMSKPNKTPNMASKLKSDHWSQPQQLPMHVVKKQSNSSVPRIIKNLKISQKLNLIIIIVSGLSGPVWYAFKSRCFVFFALRWSSVSMTPFYKTYTILYTKFGNMVMFLLGNLYWLCTTWNQHYQKIIYLFNFFIKKGRNQWSKLDNQKYVNLIISRFINNYNCKYICIQLIAIKKQLFRCRFWPFWSKNYNK